MRTFLALISCIVLGAALWSVCLVINEPEKLPASVVEYAECYTSLLPVTSLGMTTLGLPAFWTIRKFGWLDWHKNMLTGALVTWIAVTVFLGLMELADGGRSWTYLPKALAHSAAWMFGGGLPWCVESVLVGGLIGAAFWRIAEPGRARSRTIA